MVYLNPNIHPLLISKSRNPRIENLGLGLGHSAGNAVGERLSEVFRLLRHELLGEHHGPEQSAQKFGELSYTFNLS